MRIGLVVTALLLAACSAAPGPGPAPESPYVVTAIDYHFHDAHPSMPIPLDRGLQFSNQGSNIHNVTIPGTDVDSNVRPGRRITFDPVGSVFAQPGRYPFFCKFHRDRGMSGTLVIVEG